MTGECKRMRPQSAQAYWPLARTALQLVAFGVLMLVVCWVSILVPRLIGRGEGIWIANAVALSVLLTVPPRRWLAWLTAAVVGNIIAGMLTGDHLGMSVLMASCNLIEIAGSAVALRLVVGDGLDLSRADHLLRFTLIAGLAAPLVAASLAAWVLGGLRGDDAWFTFGSWVAADGLGAVILTPLLLTLRDQRRRLAATPLTRRGWLALGALAATTALVFSVRQPLAFLIPPMLLLVVFQLETLGAAWGVLIILAIAVLFTALGLGPAADRHASVADSILTAQLFLAAITLTSLPTAAALAQRRRLQAELAANAAQTAELYRRAKLAEEVAGVGYWRLDTATRVLTWSETLATAFAMDPAVAPTQGQVLKRLHRDDRHGLVDLLSEASATNEPVRHQFRVVRADGQIRHLLGKTAAERGADGKALAVFGTTIDITELKTVEAELRGAREAAEAAAAVKGDFLANMSHELRTPLTSVLGFTRLALEQPDLNTVSRGYILKASNAGQALLSTVNDILDFSKLASGQLQIRLEPTDPAVVCSETLELFTEAAAIKGVRLRFEAVRLPNRLALDPNRVRQLLLNLIGNAVKFSDDGEILLRVEWRAEDQRLVVAVKDQGPGIAAEQQSLLFRRFSQVDGSSTRRHGGTGLGLAICLGLVEAMGGEIGVESQCGQGACFFFGIPAAPTAAGDAEDADAEEANTEEAAAHRFFPPGTRILVADDHPANRELVRAVLSPFGADITEAGNGAEAVAAAAETAFDLILMDLRMPVLDGESAMRCIRRGGGPNHGAPILTFSAGADAPGAAARREAGFDGDLAKPILPIDLIAAVCAHAARGEEDLSQEIPRLEAAGSFG